MNSLVIQTVITVFDDKGEMVKEYTTDVARDVFGAVDCEGAFGLHDEKLGPIAREISDMVVRNASTVPDLDDF